MKSSRWFREPRELIRPSLRAWKLEHLLPEVRRIVEASDPAKGLTAEEVATALRARKGLVVQCFHKLNLEGLLSQGQNGPADISHCVVPRSHESCWTATRYYRR